MIFAVLSACLAAEVPACGPVLLASAGFATVEQCEAEAQRIASGWLAEHPPLIQDSLRCTPLADLPALTVSQAATGVYVHLGQVAQFEGSPDGWIANLGFVIGQDSIAVIDAGSSRQQGQALLATIRRISDKPISHLVITHMHPDHAFGAEVFREAGATIVGHAQLSQSLQARGPVYLQNLTRLYGPAAMIGTQVALPDIGVSDSLDLDLGGRVLTLTATGPAHTDNDLTVLDRTTGALFAGDLVFRDLTPVVDGSLPGWIGWMDNPRDAAPLIPGHGPLAPNWPEGVGPQREFLAALALATREALDAGLPMSQAVPAIVDALQPFAGDWASFADTAARDATAAYKELEWE